jgi:RNA polymerase sigma factor (sigma-70 family)
VAGSVPESDWRIWKDATFQRILLALAGISQKGLSGKSRRRGCTGKSLAIMNDAQLLQRFTDDGSEAAFRTLVETHLPLVLGTARRVTGNEALAEEVAQTVFILLARKARSFNAQTILAGWLHRTARFVALRAVVAEQRRQRREQESVAMKYETESDPLWQRVAPALDDAVSRLAETDRQAVLLRFFEKRSFRDIGTALGLGEEAARKRVARAVDKLREVLQRRGKDISSAALIAGMEFEFTQAAKAATLASKISTAALGNLSAGGAAGAGLLADVLAAWRWAKIKTAIAAGIGVAAVALLIPNLIPKTTGPVKTDSTAVSPAPHPAGSARHRQRTNSSALPLAAAATQPFGDTNSMRWLEVTVLDDTSGQPIPGAEIRHPFLWRRGEPSLPPLLTDAKGRVSIAISNAPGFGERVDQFYVFADAKGYASRTANWLSTTGYVYNTVSAAYTLRLEPGITISGTVVDEEDRPLTGVRVGISGSNHRGYTVGVPELRNYDYSSVSREAKSERAISTDSSGRFEVPHFPSDLSAMVVELLGPDGARRKFRTPGGKRLSADEMSEVPFGGFKNGTARLVLPRGITIDGVVVDAAGSPVSGAMVSEAVQWGNLNVLSTHETDVQGRFQIKNRAPREIILTGVAEGHGSVSTTVLVQPGMKPLRLQLAPELALRGRVINESGDPVPGVQVSVPEYLNDGLGLDWSAKTDARGSFAWAQAPTNEVALALLVPNHVHQLVFVRAAEKEHVITLRPGKPDAVRVSGKVTDKESGAALDHFQVKISYGMSDLQPDRSKRSVDGHNGYFEVEIVRSEVAVGMSPAWVLLIEADGYESTFTRLHHFEEGDQDMTSHCKKAGRWKG